MSEPESKASEASRDARSESVAGGLGIWALAWPTIALASLQSIMGVVDLVFVSSLGTEAVAAVAVAMQVHFFFFSLLAAVTAGTVAIVAREWGRGNRDEVARAARCSVALSAGIGALMLLGLPIAEPAVALLGVEPEVARLGGRCLVILLLFSIPLAVEFTLSQALRGAGDMRTPLLIGAASIVLNGIGDYALIFGHWGAPKLGAEGSAWATGGAYAAGALALYALWARDRLVLPAGYWRGSLSRLLAWRMLRVGIPSALEQTAFQGGLLTFMAVVTSFGTEAISAYLIGVRILSFCFVPGFGFASAAATLVGQNLGAERPAEAMRAGWRGAGGAIAVMSGLGLLIVAFAQPLADLFGAAGALTTSLTVTFIYILGAAQPLMALEFALGGALRGAGDTRFPLYVTLLGLFLVRLGVAVFIAKPLFGTIAAVWLCLLADYACKASLLTWRFARGQWKEIDV